MIDHFAEIVIVVKIRICYVRDVRIVGIYILRIKGQSLRSNQCEDYNDD